MAKKKKKKTSAGWLVAIIIAILSFITGKSWSEWDISQTILDQVKKYTQEEPAEQPADEWTIQQMEIPVMSAKKQGQVIHRTGYTLAYDAKTRTPQWVAWELTKKETQGTVERSNDFQPDPDVKGAKVVTKDYSHSGYDRGHMAPAADMKWSKKAMMESFYMSNICPQDHNLNTSDWSELENKSRQWARRYGKVYIVCGPIYNGKRNEYIGDHRVKVPDAFFKVVLINEKKKQCAMGFYFENEAGERKLQEYLVPVDRLEQLTGMDFFSALPDNLEDRLEAETLKELP
jgi:endonuclease G